MYPKIIKNEADHGAALARIEELMNSVPGSSEGDELELLATLVEMYEEQACPIAPPDPVEAIKFRMDQAGLRPKDLIPFIGSRSKVSEVLSGRRPLSLSMIRNLSDGLGIPVEILVKKPSDPPAQSIERMNYSRFPIVEIIKRKWLPRFAGSPAEARERIHELIDEWVAPLGPGAVQQAFLRQHIRAGSEMDEFALTAWRIRVSLLARKQKVPKYHPGSITSDFARELVRLSLFRQGPLLAGEFLMNYGIHFVVEPHMPHTHLDGAAIRMQDGSPLIALTLRYDRLDNFWFTLFHELAHVALHLDEETGAFFDDLDQAGPNECEGEANRWAEEAMIPATLWKQANLTDRPSRTGVLEFASRLRIHPAIPAGRIRKQTGNYRILKDLVGNRQVKSLFGSRPAA